MKKPTYLSTANCLDIEMSHYFWSFPASWRTAYSMAWLREANFRVAICVSIHRTMSSLIVTWSLIFPILTTCMIQFILILLLNLN